MCGNTTLIPDFCEAPIACAILPYVTLPSSPPESEIKLAVFQYTIG